MIFYDLPWWAPFLWGFAVYSVARFLIHYIWDTRHGRRP